MTKKGLNTCKISSMAGVTGCHHVFGVKHLLGELGDGEGAVLLRVAGSEWCEARHEEVKPGEWDHVHRQLTQIRVQLTREPEKILKTSIFWSFHPIEYMLEPLSRTLRFIINYISERIISNTYSFLGETSKNRSGATWILTLNHTSSELSVYLPVRMEPTMLS